MTSDLQLPYSISPNGREYECGNCRERIPDGMTVLGQWGPSGKLTGVRVETVDGEVIHQCGTKIKEGGGQHG